VADPAPPILAAIELVLPAWRRVCLSMDRHREVSENGELAKVVHENIRALLEVRRREDAKRTIADRLADRVSLFAGSMRSVTMHAVFFGSWLGWNVLPGAPKFDPYPFVMLAVIASVEAIFLSSFVLISQNRQASMNEKSAQLDLQVNLLAEHEVTRLIAMTEEIARKLGVRVPEQAFDELKKDVAPERVLDEIDRTRQPAGRTPADISRD
jgi:uncharacterized membrane protein